MIKLKIKENFKKILIFFPVVFYFIQLQLPIFAQSITPSTPPKSTTAPKTTLSPAPSAEPTSIEDEKIKEIREAIKEKVNEIKEKIEKKAYVGTITQITDSTLTLSNFRGKKRVRLTEETIIIGTNKKEIKAKDLAVDDKIIAMGILSENDILEAKRVIAVAAPKTPSPKRIIFFGTISTIDNKNSTLTLSEVKNKNEQLVIKFDSQTNFINQSDPKISIGYKDVKKDQKAIIVYFEPTANKTAIAKTIFILP